MQNFYDLFRKILTDGSDYRPSETDLEWIAAFMNNNDISIELRSTQVGTDDDGPIMRFDGSHKGQPVELFEVLSEACFQSPVMMETVKVTAAFFAEHVPFCDKCQSNHGPKCGNYRLEIIPITNDQKAD